MDARARVARNIRRIRVMGGLSQESLAVDAGIDRTYVSRLERGLENPTVAVLERMAVALSVHIEDLFARQAISKTPLPTLKPGRKAGSQRRGPLSKS